MAKNNGIGNRRSESLKSVYQSRRSESQKTWPQGKLGEGRGAGRNNPGKEEEKVEALDTLKKWTLWYWQTHAEKN